MSQRKTKKQIIEEKFHDQYASTVNLDEINVSENFSLAAQENRHAAKLFGDVKGKKILDLGCGFGETAVFWAQKGASVDAVDISAVSIYLAEKLAKKHKISGIHFQQMAAEDLKFKNNYFDFVFGNGVLHHVDISKTIKEVHRVLKKGGLAIFVEPLTYNPLINIYRTIADKVRTPTEKPLSFANINKMRKIFSYVGHHEYHFLTLLIFVWFYLVAGVSPNQERYWRKILQVKGNLRSFLKFLIFVDKIVLKLIPPLRYFCWNTVIELRKIAS